MIRLQFDIAGDPPQGSRVTDFDNAKGTVTYVPKEGYFGGDKFSFKVTDDKGSQSNVADVTVNVNEVTTPSQNQENEENNGENTENTTQVEENTNTNTNTNAQVLVQPNQAPKLTLAIIKKQR